MLNRKYLSKENYNAIKQRQKTFCVSSSHGIREINLSADSVPRVDPHNKEMSKVPAGKEASAFLLCHAVPKGAVRELGEILQRHVVIGHRKMALN